LVVGPLVPYVHICALKGIGALDWVAYCTQVRMIWLVITYGAICLRLLPDGIAYFTITCHDSILSIIPYGYVRLRNDLYCVERGVKLYSLMHPHMDMLIYCSKPWTIHPFYPDSSSICD